MDFRFYYNAVAGNIFDGHRVKMILEDNSEHLLYFTPQNKIITEGCSHFSLSENINGVPYTPIYNIPYAISGWYVPASDQSFFDPMSVNYLAESFSWNHIDNSITSKAGAFPGKVGELRCVNHFLDYSDKDYTPPMIVPGQDQYGRHGDLRNKNYFSSIVEEDLKKDVFNIGFSFNIEELEEQYGRTYKSIWEDDNFRYLKGVRYPISSDKTIDHSKKISVSQTKNGLQIATNGADFRIKDDAAIAERSNFITQGIWQKGRVDNWYRWENISTGKVSTFPKSSNVLEVNMPEDLPSSFYFVDELLTLRSSSTSAGNVLLLPVYNDNNLNDYYFKVIQWNTSSSVPPASESLVFGYLGDGRLWKDKDANKWKFTFSSTTVTPPYKVGNSNVGHFECSGDLTPWSSTQTDGLAMYYVDGKGNTDNTVQIYIFPYRLYSSSYRGIPIPYLLGDERFRITTWNTKIGVYIRPRFKLYRDDYQKSNTYVCTESALYSIPV